MSEYKPTYRTPRFDIFHTTIVRNPRLGVEREVYQAWFRDEDVCHPICVVTISSYTMYVEMVEVNPIYRRQGIATEVLECLTDKLGVLRMDAATDDGERFLDAWKGPVK